ncbi:hypothetical protein [uncultured Winogradskyella sp.]|uniref:hypothetical protein n=1 Tax=uncultured Winogradskyella sp. TaxID=395353 RepID=UPI002634C46E|nr:hypothetical protein [uncultured Winogradskyella sp.]
MNKVKIKYCSARTNTQVMGTDNEYVLATVYFNIKGLSYECKVQQPQGGSDGTYENDPLEVFMPDELKNKLKYEPFREATEIYYRMCVGSNGMFQIQGGKNISLTSLFYEKNHVAEVELISGSGAW